MRGGGCVGAASGEQLGPWAAFGVVGKRGRSPEAGLPAGADMAPQDRSHTSQTTPPRSACLCFQYFPAQVALWGYISHPLRAGSVAKEGQSGGCHLTRAQARPAPRRPCCSLSVLGRPTRDRGGAGRSPWSREPHRLLAAASLQALTGAPVAREQASLSWGRGTLLALRFPRVAPGSSWETGPPTKSVVFRPPHPAASTSIPRGLVKLLVSPDTQAGLTSQPKLRPWGPSEESQLRKPRFRTRPSSQSQLLPISTQLPGETREAADGALGPVPGPERAPSPPGQLPRGCPPSCPVSGISGLQNRPLRPHTSGPRPTELGEEGVTGERFGGTPACP